MTRKTAATPTVAPVSPDPGGVADYIVTDTAPPRVAGRRVAAGDILQLTEDQARSELIALHIRPAV
ncbi:hypothetical protein [Pannonibacter sp. SL95]|uniref:hypothetical protein n=1 Tax=Pannonibacter sp. SL95 TaxID=2995153 RepID=UPI002275B6A7|nr:hypothetical protein [Pannonibacter sp. SL95]MCY1705241.1 hypothetical protein [Pannonibacter sp. SL95]